MMHHRVAQILCRFTPETPEHSFWASTPDFQYVLQQMATLIKIKPSDPWRVTLCWTPPLFLIATRCRVTRLRREALRLLHTLERVERGWTSCIAHAIAEFVVNQEEAPHGADQASISFSYVRLLSIQFQPEKASALIIYEKRLIRKALA